jgi:hypothetical protein
VRKLSEKSRQILNRLLDKDELENIESLEAFKKVLSCINEKVKFD